LGVEQLAAGSLIQAGEFEELADLIAGTTPTGIRKYIPILG